VLKTKAEKERAKNQVSGTPMRLRAGRFIADFAARWTTQQRSRRGRLFSCQQTPPAHLTAPAGHLRAVDVLMISAMYS